MTGENAAVSSVPRRTGAPTANWEELLLVFLREPFDKALQPGGHAERAARYAGAALGREIAPDRIRPAPDAADPFAVASELPPMPPAGPTDERDEGADGQILLTHPLSGQEADLRFKSVVPEEAVGVVASIAADLPTARERFLAIWRLLPEGLAERFGTDAARLAPSLPNRFVALAPWGPDGDHAEHLRRKVLDAGQAAKRRLADAVLGALDPAFRQLDPAWARRWRPQIAGMFEFHCTATPVGRMTDDRLAQLVGPNDFEAAWPSAGAIRRLARILSADRGRGGAGHAAGRWQAPGWDTWRS